MIVDLICYLIICYNNDHWMYVLFKSKFPQDTPTTPSLFGQGRLIHIWYRYPIFSLFTTTFFSHEKQNGKNKNCDLRLFRLCKSHCD